MTTQFSYKAHRSMSLFGIFAAHVGDLFDHLIGRPSMKPLPAMSRRQQLAAAVDAAKRIKRGGHR